MFNKYAFLLFLCMSQWCFFANAQIVDPLDFFPHHEGDIWEYWRWDAPPEQNIITSDSLSADGKYYLETTMFGPVIVDTTSFEVFFRPDNHKWFRLDADSGTTFTVYAEIDSNGQGYRISGTIGEIYQDFIFGQLVTVKRFDYYLKGIGDPDSLWSHSYHLAMDFGLVLQEADLQPYDRLVKGAIINNVRWGDVTSINKLEIALPPDFVLHQNSPNPFNPTTIISYEIKNLTHVKLAIYDLLGREIQLLVDKTQLPGSYYIEFNAESLSSGMYVYRLATPGKSTSRRMLIIR